MFEVIIGYFTTFADFIKSIIDSIKSLISFARGDENASESPVQDDEALLQSRSLFND